MPKEGIEKLAERARRVDVRDVPLDVKPKKYIVEEVPMDGRAPTDRSETISYISADGNTYRFAMRGADGNILPNRIPLTIFLSLREVEIGGLASTVMEAFRVSIDDLDGKAVFPIPTPAEPDEMEDSDFTLGG